MRAGLPWRLGFVCLLLASGCQQLAVDDDSDLTSGPGIEFGTDWLPLIKAAEAKFSQYNPNMACFVVSLGEDEGGTRSVSLLVDEVRVENGVMIIQKPPGCGVGVSYEFDKSGKLLREILQR